jgi:hypothetical protein
MPQFKSAKPFAVAARWHGSQASRRRSQRMEFKVMLLVRRINPKLKPMMGMLSTGFI